ncbi:MAG: NUDIX domain-containing protein, partial [Patescibacteria group bacterium]
MESEKTLLQAVLCFFVRGDQVLLAKKMKAIGKGRLNGYGGGIEPGETPLKAIVREVAEESGGAYVGPEDLVKVAVADFHNTKEDGATFICRVHTYIARSWIGNP